MRRFLIVVLLFCSVFCFINNINYSYANEFVDNEEKKYIIYDELGNYLFEKIDIEVGDAYISYDFKKYEIISVDEDGLIGIAKFVRFIDKPNIVKNDFININNNLNKKIGMYLTHNDESYVPTDKTESVYGKGGIHDVANVLKKELNKYGITVYLDESLHIPHDTSAYSRSKKTAQKLLNNYELDAIFDIHRDGASRSYYVKNINGKERCRIRMVVGKSNPNREVTEQFAVYLMSIGQELYPWLFSDIYIGSGHYNQNLNNQAMLFEMGSHLVEKELVIESIEPLAEVINTALYGSTVNTENGDVTINGDVTNENEVTIEESLQQIKRKNTSVIPTILIGVGIGGVVSFLWYRFVKISKLKHKK